MSEHEDRPEEAAPGKARTWWHPLLVRLLNFVLEDAYHVRDEVSVGRMPLRVDVLLIRRDDGVLSESARRSLPVLTSLLNRFTLIELKGPTDTLERGDLGQLLGCAHLWLSQQLEEIASKDVSLVVLAPVVTEPLRRELQLLGLRAEEVSDGTYRVDGAAFATWLVETDRLAEQDEPVVTLVSRALLRDVRALMAKFQAAGQANLFSYTIQQVQQLSSLPEEIAMRYKDVEQAKDVDAAFKEAMLKVLPVEDILKRLSVEDRVKGLSQEELARFLRELMRDPDQRAYLRELLDEAQDREQNGQKDGEQQS